MREYYDINKLLTADGEYTMILGQRAKQKEIRMRLVDAVEKIKNRKFPTSYENISNAITPKRESEMIIEQADADIMAIRCIEAQIRLSESLNKFWDYSDENDTYSAKLVYEILSGIRFDAKFDEDGMFDLEATENERL